MVEMRTGLKEMDEMMKMLHAHWRGNDQHAYLMVDCAEHLLIP